jgi:hypothetical protein
LNGSVELENTSFDEDLRKFFGTFYFPTTWEGMDGLHFEIIFSEDYMTFKSASVTTLLSDYDDETELYDDFGDEWSVVRDLNVQCYDGSDFDEWTNEIITGIEILVIDSDMEWDSSSDE